MNKTDFPIAFHDYFPIKGDVLSQTLSEAFLTLSTLLLSRISWQNIPCTKADHEIALT